MQISEIHGFHLASDLPEPQGNSIGFVDRVEALVVCLVTDNGLVGWGETWFAPAAAWAILESQLAPHVLGRNPFDRNSIWHGMAGTRGYDRRGHTLMAVSAVDLALWDIAGRAEGVPVWKLLGGALRDRVQAYASGPYFRPNGDPYRRFLPEIAKLTDMGFRAFKLRLGTTPAADRSICLAVRNAIGPDCLLAVDLNQGFTRSTALNIASAISDCDVAWMEEPLPPEDLSGYRQLAAASPVPLAAGEALAGCEAFHELIGTEACAVIQPDLERISS